MKKQLTFILLLTPCILTAMQNDSSLSQLIALITKGANVIEVKSFLDKPGVEWEIMRGDDDNAVADLSQTLKALHFDQRDSGLYERFQGLFLHRSYYDRRYEAWWQEQEIALMYENDARQEAIKAAAQVEKEQSK